MPSRLDVALCERGVCPSRSRAQAAIENGAVMVNGIICKKSAKQIEAGDVIVLLEEPPFVSRGGQKLQHALSVFQLDLNGLSCLDIGASTGGFTDCMLQNGAKSVLSVDVGHGQLAQKLRDDPRVHSMEGTDLRALRADENGLPAEFAACDVSFISLTQILPYLKPLLLRDAYAVLLVKPQFEVGRNGVGKHGVVKDEKLRLQALQNIIRFAQATGFSPLNSCESPIKGGSGNTEYLLLIHNHNISAQEATL